LPARGRARLACVAGIGFRSEQKRQRAFARVSVRGAIRAREAHWHEAMVDDMIDIAKELKESSPAAVNKGRLLIDTKKWIVWLYRRYYGDRVEPLSSCPSSPWPAWSSSTLSPFGNALDISHLRVSTSSRALFTPALSPEWQARWCTPLVSNWRRRGEAARACDRVARHQARRSLE
jgi:hypothetical protein